MEHKPIYLDGVDVNRCIDFNKRDKVSCYHILYDKCNENPNCYFKQLARKTQVIDEIEEVIKPYQEQIELDALSLPSAIESILERKTQECDIWKNQVLVLDEESVTVQVTQEQFEEYQKLKQECEKLSILAQEESARNGYVEYELNDKLKQKMQELYFARNEIHSKTEYIQEQRDIIDQLKQECEEPKERNKVLQKLVSELEYSVQTGIELNARRCNALEEIEEIVNKKTETSICSECAYNHLPECKDNCMQDALENILDIINKTKDGKNEQL